MNFINQKKFEQDVAEGRVKPLPFYANDNWPTLACEINPRHSFRDDEYEDSYESYEGYEGDDDESDSYILVVYARLYPGGYKMRLTLSQWYQQEQSKLFSIPKSLMNRTLISRANGMRHSKKRKHLLPISTQGIREIFGQEYVKYKPKVIDSNLTFETWEQSCQEVGLVIDEARKNRDLSVFSRYQALYKDLYLARGGKPFPKLFKHFVDLVNQKC